MANLTNEELKNIEIQQWGEIRSNYGETVDLFVGNGLSIGLSEGFTSSSLFNSFIQGLPEQIRTLFESFGTNSFELILNYLNQATKINSTFTLSTSEIAQSIKALKDGLISTLEQIHPRKDYIDENRLMMYARNLNSFGDVYTTNCDLYLYRIIMKHKNWQEENNSIGIYEDYLRDKKHRDGYTKFISEKKDTHNKCVYYLHGALFIFELGDGVFKINRTGDIRELMTVIGDEIQRDHFPLYVTEGTAREKLNAIRGNEYLNFCWDNFRESNRPFLIFGSSLSDCDAHIVDVLKGKQQRLIISIYTEKRNIHELEYEKVKWCEKFQRDGDSNIEFVNYKSVFPSLME